MFFDFFQCLLAGQQFFISANSLFYAVTVFNFFEIFGHAATFFLPEFIVHKYSVEGYWEGSAFSKRPAGEKA